MAPSKKRPAGRPRKDDTPRRAVFYTRNPETIQIVELVKEHLRKIGMDVTDNQAISWTLHEIKRLHGLGSDPA